MDSRDRLCVNCFHVVRGGYEVCPYCGFIKGDSAKAMSQLRPGTILADRYIMGEVLGQGGFGITYKAYDTNLGMVVAVKEFYPSRQVIRAENETRVSIFSAGRAEEYQKMLERFLEEARNVALFWKESDIVNVLSWFEENNTAYMIMEYIGGSLLKEYLEPDIRLQPQEACAYMCAILQALSKVHAKGIIHRDVGPDNIFLTGEQSVKLIDFGNAKFQTGDSDKNRSIVVKPGYSPPEQYRSKGQQDLRSDIYSAGAVFYRMLIGHRPPEALERMDADRLDFSEPGVKISTKLKKDIQKALALNPNDRFASADEFRAAIEEHASATQKSGILGRFRK